MRLLNHLLLGSQSQSTITPDTVALSDTSAAQTMDHMVMWHATANILSANIANKTFVSGVLAVHTITFPSKAGSTGGDYIEFFDQSGAAWAAALNKAGSDPAPTGAVWASIPNANKTNVDISAQTTAAQVAAAVKTALNLLSGFTAVITLDDSAADGTMLVTQVVRGPVSNSVKKNADDSGAGSITDVSSTAGVLSKVDPTNDVVTIASHGYTTGALVTLTTSSALPTGLATSTNYYLIAVDANTLGFATSQANALAGTKIDITGFGTGTQTVAVTTTIAGSLKFQANDEPDGVAAIWVDLAGTSEASQNFSAAGTLKYSNQADVGYRQIRAVCTVTSGTVTVALRLNAKGYSNS